MREEQEGAPAGAPVFALRFLAEDSYTDLHHAFVRAFSDYALDMTYLSERALYNRAVKNGIDFECSVGAYVDEELVGFTMVGVDHWKGERTAFDIATGIVPEYCGRDLARGMLDHAVPRLRERGVRRFALEVLQQNENAIRAYRKAGFESTRELDCFELDLATLKTPATAPADLEIDTADRSLLEDFEESLDWEPSWENSFASIRRIPDKVVLYAARLTGKPIGLIVYYPTLAWITSLIVKRPHRRRGVGGHLVRHLAGTLRDGTTTVKLLNVDSGDKDMIRFLERLGFHRYTAQFEMEMNL